MSRYRSQVREVINRNTFISLALAEGFNAFVPVYDGGVDFLLHRESDGVLRKVQMKARWTIDRKYLGRDIWIAFPHAGEWYLIPHDKMVAMADAAGVTKTSSWLDKGHYNKGKPSKSLMAECSPYRFKSIDDVTADAANDDAENT